MPINIVAQRNHTVTQTKQENEWTRTQRWMKSNQCDNVLSPSSTLDETVKNEEKRIFSILLFFVLFANFRFVSCACVCAFLSLCKPFVLIADNSLALTIDGWNFLHFFRWSILIQMTLKVKLNGIARQQRFAQFSFEFICLSFLLWQILCHVNFNSFV